MQVPFTQPEDRTPDVAQPSERERFLEAVLASSGDCIKVLDLNANLIFMSEGGQRVMEVSDFNAIAGCPWPDFWHGMGNTAAKNAIAAARAGGIGRFRGEANTFKGNPRWWDVMVTPIFGADGRPERLLSVSRDITAMMQTVAQLEASEAQTRLMSDELQHRVKNTLAMVQAIIRQTMRNSPSMAVAQESIDHRLAAMGRAHGMLSTGGGSSSELHEIITTALDLHDDHTARFRLEGPNVYLPAQATTALAMVLHELGVNATKYGALSVPNGRVSITWALTPKAEHDNGWHVLKLVWSEQGGPPVTPPAQRGFGSKLIERALASSLQGEAVISFLNEGVVCNVSALLEPLNSPS